MDALVKESVKWRIIENMQILYEEGFFYNEEFHIISLNFVGMTDTARSTDILANFKRTRPSFFATIHLLKTKTKQNVRKFQLSIYRNISTSVVFSG